MERGCRRWRAAQGLAGVLGLVTSGCHWLPVHRVDHALDPRRLESRPAGMTAVAPEPAADGGVRLPATPLQPISDSEALGDRSTPTPLLDAALARARDSRQVVIDDLAVEDPDPAPEPVSPAKPAPVPPPVESPAPETPLPSETVEPEITSTDPPSPSVPKVAPEIPDVEPRAATTPEEQWREGLERLHALARAESDESADDPDASRWAIRERWLTLLDETTAEITTGGDPSLWTTVLMTLAESCEDGPPTDLHAAASVLEAEAPLEIDVLQLCRRVQGFGNYEPVDATHCRAGEPLILYCEMLGLHYVPDGDLFRSRLESSVEILPDDADTPIWEHVLGVAEDTCRRRRRDYYVNYRLTLPESLPPGSYQLRMIQQDVLGGGTTIRTLPLRIVKPEPSEPLALK